MRGLGLYLLLMLVFVVVIPAIFIGIEYLVTGGIGGSGCTTEVGPLGQISEDCP